MLKSFDADDFCRAYPDSGRFEILLDNEIKHFPLPWNVTSREKLNSAKGEHFPHSFHDVPELETGPAYAVHLKDCLLVRWTNKWSNDFYAVISANRKNILVPGTGYSPEHRFFAHEKKIPSYADGTFIFGMWYKNYYLWLTVYMSKLLLAMETRSPETLILPEQGRLTPVNKYCLELVGVDQPIILPDNENCWHFDQLTFFNENPYRGHYLKKFRDIVLAQVLCGQAKKKVYVSRSNAHYRHLENEEEVQRLFQARGWEIYHMEELSVQEQIQLMSETVAFASLHGAGFGNIIFCQEGAHIFEFSVRERPNANFYSLAVCMGHHYWLGEARTCGKNPEVIYDDAVVNCGQIDEIIGRIESEL